MAHDSIQRLIDGTYPDPDGGPPLRVPTRRVAIADSLAGDEGELVRGLGFAGNLAVVSDPRTREVLGARVERAVAGLGRITAIELPDHPHADAGTAAAIRRRSAACDALIAVGSGTINDLCKYVAAQDGKPYAVFATAPSMNGYTSLNAAITIDGHKKSLPATAAAGVFIDLGVFAAAPARMIRSGLGDSACRATAQSDWLLSHHLLDTPYRRAPFALLMEDEAELLGEPEALLRGDLAAMRRLARTLVLSGFGMTICGGSYPASQGEHLISHYIDMMAPADRPGIFHGEQIAVTTLTMAALQRSFVQAERPPRLHATALAQDELTAHFGPAVGMACWREFEGKRLDAAAAEAVNARLKQVWPRLVADIDAIAIAPAALRRSLLRAAVPTTAADIAVSPRFYANAVRYARTLRDRFTFLDLADDAGHLYNIEAA